MKKAKTAEPNRPEAAGAFALPRHEFGFDVIARVGRPRYTERRSVPEIRAHLVGRAVSVPERTVTNLLDRYDALLAASLTDDRRLRTVLASRGGCAWRPTGPNRTSGTTRCG